MAVAAPKAVSKDSYKNIADKAERKAAKKAYKEALNFNEEIEISKFVCEELNKFDTPVFKHEFAVYTKIYADGLKGIQNMSVEAVGKELDAARALPKETADEKAIRSFEIQVAKNKLHAKSAFDKYFGAQKTFEEPSMEALTALFEREDALEEKMAELVKEKDLAHKAKDDAKVHELADQIKALKDENKELEKQAKVLQDEFAKFNRAAKPYNDARKFLRQEEDFKHFDEIAALYDEAKEKAEEEERLKEERLAKKRAEEEAELAARKAAKAAKSNRKK